MAQEIKRVKAAHAMLLSALFDRASETAATDFSIAESQRSPGQSLRHLVETQLKPHDAAMEENVHIASKGIEPHGSEAQCQRFWKAPQKSFATSSRRHVAQLVALGLPNFYKGGRTAMTTQSEPVVLLDVSDSVGWITLNRPRAYNALNTDLAGRLLDAVVRCDEDDHVRALVITGKGPSFCAGGDIRQMMDAVASDGQAAAFLKTLTVSLHQAIVTMAHMSKPVIMAVNGAAAGAGFSLALAGDLVLAADNARFTVAYTAIGLAPDGSSTFTLPRLIGPKRAFELIYTNRALSANEAKELGLVNQVFPTAQFIERSREFAANVAKGPTAALGCAKKLLTLSAQNSLETQMEHERRAIAACGRTADFREGADAFFAKRPPKFQGH